MVDRSRKRLTLDIRSDAGRERCLAFGILAALWERERSGQGQVVDAAIVDGVSSMMSFFAGLLPGGRISLQRERNLLGGAAPHYRCYRCADGREIAIGPLEPQFLAELLRRIEAPAPRFSRTPGAIRGSVAARDWD